jgi:hypothetical protein
LEEKNQLANIEKLKLLDRNRMRYVAFSAFSNTYLDNEEETKGLLVEHLKYSSNPFVTIELNFKVR